MIGNVQFIKWCRNRINTLTMCRDKTVLKFILQNKSNLTTIDHYHISLYSLNNCSKSVTSESSNMPNSHKSTLQNILSVLQSFQYESAYVGLEPQKQKWPNLLCCSTIHLGPLEEVNCLDWLVITIIKNYPYYKSKYAAFSFKVILVLVHASFLIV